MRVSLAASIGLHAAILAAALVVLPSAHQEPMPVDAIQVDISNIADANKLMATAKDAPGKVETPAPKKADVVRKTDETLKVAKDESKAAKEAAAPPPPPPPPPQPKPEPPKEQPKKEEPPPPDPDAMAKLLQKVDEPPPEPRKPEPKKEEPKKAEEKPKPVKKPEKKVAKLDYKKLDEFLNSEALLDKSNDQKTTNASDAAVDGQPVKGERDLQGKDQALSASTITALVQRIRECWRLPAGARDTDILVKVHLQLNLDGSLAAPPEVTNGPGDFVFETTARSTVAAITECQNYDFLPAEQYDVWKDLVLNFKPSTFAAAAPTQ